MVDTLDIVSLAQIKAHLNVTLDEDDDILAGFLEAARAYVEGYCGPLDAFEGAIPANLVLALKEAARFFYDARDPDKPALYALPPGVFDLMAGHRKWSFGA